MYSGLAGDSRLARYVPVLRCATTVAGRWNTAEGNNRARRELMAAYDFHCGVFPTGAKQRVVFHTLDA